MIALAVEAPGGEPVKPEVKEQPQPAVTPKPADAAAQAQTPATPNIPKGPEQPDELPRAKLENGVFMQSGSIKIMESDVNKVLTLMLTDEKKRNPKNIPSAERMLRSRVEISEILLQNEVIKKYARDNNLSTSEADLEKFIDVKKLELKRDNSSFEQMLADNGLTELEFRAFWSAKLAIEKFAAAKVTNADVDAFFNEKKETLPLRSAAHILFQYKNADSAPKTLERTKDEARAGAEAVLKQLKAGADFNTLAAKSDDDATKANGGALSYFPLKGKDAMVEAFGKAAYGLAKEGELSPVVETPYGFHIIKLTGIRDSEFKEEVKRYLGLQKFDELLRPVLMSAVEAAKFNEALVKPEEPTPPPAAEKAAK
jgi:parvulin-like peptidyl-prolyl isomerase